MSICQKRAVAIGLLLITASVGVGFTFAQPAEPIPPETLLPASSVLYFRLDGGAEHQAAWEQTAAYEALYKSGLMDVVGKLFADVQKGTGGEQGIAGQVGGVIDHLRTNGISLAVAVGEAENQPPLPWAILVAHDAGQYEEGVMQLAQMASRGEVQFEKSELHGRQVTHGTLPRTPGIEVGWWAEGEHLVIVAGMQAVENALQVADGGENITTSELWTDYAVADADFEVAGLGWLDFEALLEAYGQMPLPSSRNETHPAGVSINEVAEITGLNGLKSIVGRSGYKDRALWSEVNVDAPGPRQGLLAMMDQQAFSFEDLPSLPVGTSGFSATSFNWSQAYDTLFDVAKKVELLLPAASWRAGIASGARQWCLADCTCCRVPAPPASPHPAPSSATRRSRASGTLRRARGVTITRLRILATTAFLGDLIPPSTGSTPSMPSRSSAGSTFTIRTRLTRGTRKSSAIALRRILTMATSRSPTCRWSESFSA